MRGGSQSETDRRVDEFVAHQVLGREIEGHFDVEQLLVGDQDHVLDPTEIEVADRGVGACLLYTSDAADD